MSGAGPKAGAGAEEDQLPELERLTVSEALEAIAARTPAPGGGAVASMTAALAAAIARMVLAYSIGRRTANADRPALEAGLDRLRGLGERALGLAAEDAAAYGRLNRLWKLPPDDPRRRAEWDDAVRAAVAAPLAVMETCLEILELLCGLRSSTNPKLASDLAIAAILAEAGSRCAACSVEVNLPQIGDPAEAERAGAAGRSGVGRARALAAEIESDTR